MLFDPMTAPFPWFGGKRNAADQVWRALGDVDCYVEPFGGSAAVLLRRPHPGKVETYNDTDGLLCNAWRAIAHDPDAVTAHLDWPVSELDLHARHLVLVEARARLTDRLMADPDYYDARLGAWWVWGACCWIGSGWCSGTGPWGRGDDGTVVGDAGQGIRRKLPHLSNAGQGIHRQLPHLSNAGKGIHRQLPHLGNAGLGIHRQLLHSGVAGKGVGEWIQALSARLRRVRVACGDWKRVCTPPVVERHGLAGVLFDPPYTEGWDPNAAYAGQDGDVEALWDEVTACAIDLSERGVRVVVCGYDGMWSPPNGWSTRSWKARKGYAADGGARHRTEKLWCSPACIPEVEMSLFGGDNA